MSQNPAQKVSEAVVRQTLNQMNSSIDLAHRSLVTDSPRPQVPEEVFTVLFLPYFSGQDIPKDRNVMLEWVSAAGSAMAEVDIVDRAGKVLYTVPPIFSTDMLKLTRDRALGDYSEMVSETQMLSHQSGMKAMTYADQASAAKIRESVDPTKTQVLQKTTEERWGQIFDRYDIPRAPGKEVKTPEAKSLSNNGQDDLIYD